MAAPTIVIAGPTGVGKSDLAVGVAEAIGGEIVNFDSVQVYRGFDIGSAKPPVAIRQRVPHHLYDIVDADEELNAADYARRAKTILAEVHDRGRPAILVGGTFFYLRALLGGLPEMPGRDEALRARLRAIADTPRGAARLHRWLLKIDPARGRKIAAADRHRVERALEVYLLTGKPISHWPEPTADNPDEMPALKIALSLPRPTLVTALDARVEAMYAAGLVEETRALLARFPREARAFGTIGYREAAAVVTGELAPAAAIAETKRRTRAYAKRQMTWLRGERNVQWLDATTKETNLAAALRLIEDNA